jgi:hypothetical protein
MIISPDCRLYKYIIKTKCIEFFNIFIQQIQIYLFIHLTPSALIVMLQSLFPSLFQI